MLLDQALLFFSSFLSFIFAASIVYVSLPFSTEISSLTVLVIIATLLPLYVGYLRGAIELDSIFERTRGWVYLIFGVGAYLILLAIHWLVLTQEFALPAPVILMAGLLLLYLLTRNFVRWVYVHVAGYVTPSEDMTGFAGVLGGLFVSMSFWLAIAALGRGFNTLPITDVFLSRVVSIFESVPLLMPLLYAEFNCHHSGLVRRADSYYHAYMKQHPMKRKGGSFLVELIESLARSTFMILIDTGYRRLIEFAVWLSVVLVGGFLISISFWVGLGLMMAGDIFLIRQLWMHMSWVWKSKDL